MIGSELSFVPVWAFCTAHYAQSLRAGVPFLAMSYDELNNDRLASLGRLFEHCDLPTTAVTGAGADSGFGADV
ncbi:MAG: hypothetical protein JKX69_06310 [Rhodobacteraceae bacterium]|nr:hypothetical protein [Paracoccaceae bacterium]